MRTIGNEFGFFFILFFGLFWFAKTHCHDDSFKPAGLPIDRVIVNHLDPELRHTIEQETINTQPKTYQPSAYNQWIKILVQKYDLANITLELTPTDPPGKVVLSITLFDKERIETFAFSGNRLLTGEKILNKTGLKSGIVLNEVSLALTREKILRLYREIGYFSAEVEFAVTSGAGGPLKKNLAIRIEEGSPTPINQIFLLGFGRLSPRKIERLIGLRPGTPLNIALFKDRISQLKSYLKEKKFFQAKIFNPVFELVPDRQGVNIYLAAHLGRRMNIDFTGDLGFAEEIIQSALSPETLSDASSGWQKEIENNLRTFYQKEGYFKAEIQVQVDRSNEEATIEVEIGKNEIAKLQIDKITGTQTFSKNQLWPMYAKDPMESSKLAVYSEKNVAALCEGMREQLKTRGYAGPECQIVANSYNASLNQGIVSLNVNEGRLWSIHKIEMVGNIDLPENEIRFALGFAEGSGFSQEKMDHGRKNIIALCQGKGYLDCEVQEKMVLDDATGNAILTYLIHEGELALVGKIDLSGNQKTSDYLIRRKIKLETGTPLTAEKLKQAKKDIEALGLFRRVLITDLGKQDGGQRHDIAINVEETKSIHVEIGGGFGSLYDEDAVFFQDNIVRTFGLIRHNNFFGGGESVYLRGGLKRRLTNADLTERSLAVGYREPDILSSQINGNVELLTSLEDEIAFDTDEKQLTLKLDRSFEPGISAVLKYTYEISRTFNFETSEDTTEELEENFILGSLGPVVSWDNRNDKFTPTRGTFTSASSELFHRYFFSDEEFLKSSIRNDLFFKLFDFFIFSVSVRGGAMQKLDFEQTIPRSKLFFLGGAGSLRGFREDYVGTASTFINGSPIGGTIFVNYLSEIMIPVFEKFYVAVFSDGGNVYADSADFSPGDLRHSAGAGIRYVTPIGPVKLDYGIILDRQEGENFGSIHFSLGVF